MLAQKVIGVTADGRFGPHHGGRARHLAVQARRAGDQEARQRDLGEDGLPQARPGPRATRCRSTSTSCSESGSTGAAVKALQKAIGKLTVDGSYGPATEARVKEYQKAKGLTVTGVIDRKVWYALMGRQGDVPATRRRPPRPRLRPAHPDAPTPRPTSPLAKYAGLTLKLWSRGEAVKALQKAHRQARPSTAPTAALTEARVKEYQKAKGLTVTGVTDAKVWKALMAPDRLHAARPRP